MNSEKYSYKDFTGQTLDFATDLDNITIYGSCFSQEILDRHVFPENVTGLVLIKCNLDNVYLPAGATAEQCSRRRFQAQEDGVDWILDENNNPVEKI